LAKLTSQDADHLDDRPSKKRKIKKDERRDDADEISEEAGLTVQHKAIRVKHAMDQYKALDHEDMVCHLPFFPANRVHLA